MRALAQIFISALCKSRKQLEYTAKSRDAPKRLGTLTCQADYQKLSSLYSNGLLLCVFIHEHLSGTKLLGPVLGPRNTGTPKIQSLSSRRC